MVIAEKKIATIVGFYSISGLQPTVVLIFDESVDFLSKSTINPSSQANFTNALFGLTKQPKTQQRKTFEKLDRKLFCISLKIWLIVL